MRVPCVHVPRWAAVYVLGAPFLPLPNELISGPEG